VAGKTLSLAGHAYTKAETGVGLDDVITLGAPKNVVGLPQARAGRGSLRHVAHSGIRDMILNGELAPGERVLEVECAKRLQISRTPVREAIARLVSEGLIARTDDRVPVVCEISADGILDILAVRRVLEVEAVRRACDSPGRDDLLALRREVTTFLDNAGATAAEHKTVDERLHLAFPTMARSPLLTEMIGNLRTRTRVFDKGLLPERFEPGCREHIAIIDAVLGGDADAAEAAMRVHLGNVVTSIIDHLKRRSRGPSADEPTCRR
jgi:DNA-binding GntR family transcriptional regulator